MAFRFRKSIKIAPGVRLNLSKGGMSVTAGMRGASVNLGSRGVYGNLGVPGTGLSYRTKLGGSSSSTRHRHAGGPAEMSVRLALQDDGQVEITDAAGNPLPRKIMKMVKEQQGERIQQWLEEQCEMWNNGIDEILNLHLHTPAPGQQRTFQPEPFIVSPPAQPEAEPIGILGRLFSSQREKIELRIAAVNARYQQALAAWQAQKAEHERHQNERQTLFEQAQNSDPEAMQVVLEGVFQELDWPRETNISFQIDDEGKRVFIDVDLPEIEDTPTHQATVAARGLKLNIKERSDTQRRKEYMTHVHAVGFRLIGEAFAVFPSVEEVVLSGYSQRPDKATGQVDDEYLYSVRVRRDTWSEINFRNLSELDLPACFERFDLRRKMTKTGVFRRIEPFGLETAEL